MDPTSFLVPSMFPIHEFCTSVLLCSLSSLWPCCNVCNTCLIRKHTLSRTYSYWFVSSDSHFCDQADPAPKDIWHLHIPSKFLESPMRSPSAELKYHELGFPALRATNVTFLFCLMCLCSLQTILMQLVRNILLNKVVLFTSSYVLVL